MEKAGTNMHLREWLIAQVDSGKYAGLTWENQNKTMFRIPWKHAAKQDYNLNDDAALFKAWAVYKGKYREGRDKADPTSWKTRLRCALNKSTDFQEVPECSQLDVSEPYKAYRIQVVTETGRYSESPETESQVIIQTRSSSAHLRNTITHHPQFGCHRESEERDGRVNPSGTPQMDSCAPFSIFSPTPQISDFRVRVCLFYQDQLVVDVTTSTPDGCFILHGQVPLGNERIYGPCTAQQVPFPPPGVIHLPPCIAEAMGRLLPHLERGVLVWVAPDGVFIKRFCQGRVYWSGPLAQHTDRPNKLNRERTCKLLNTPIFLNESLSPSFPFCLSIPFSLSTELQDFLKGAGPKPRYEIDLCFGEEFPDASPLKTRKLIIAQVVPLFAVNLLQRCQRLGP
ncbi:interferon regulatory factor 4 isoform X2 [Salvelinus sp. IW2-2015]|uniref:interferon regulatory factor 4 isoform X2 n=1 Tax=Salvelinus sp. IW2-2015 TaxID=2691554 RepID=UPI0038D40DD3